MMFLGFYIVASVCGEVISMDVDQFEVGNAPLPSVPSQDGSIGQQAVVVASTPVTLSLVSTGGSAVPRRRFQRGQIIQRGLRKPVWVGMFREDRLGQTGAIQR